MYKFEEQLRKLRSKFTDDFAISPHVMSARIVEGNSAAYALVHMIHFLCIIILHREYIPYYAGNCRDTGPRGPIDPPSVDEEGIPPNFWKNSSQKCFEAARDLKNLTEELDKKGGLVETSLCVFANHQVAVCGR